MLDLPRDVAAANEHENSVTLMKYASRGGEKMAGQRGFDVLSKET